MHQHKPIMDNLLNVVGVIFTGADIYKNGLNTKNGTDLVFGGIAFVPGVGWVISGAYFLGDELIPGGWGSLKYDANYINKVDNLRGSATQITNKF